VSAALSSLSVEVARGWTQDSSATPHLVTVHPAQPFPQIPVHRMWAQGSNNVTHAHIQDTTDSGCSQRAIARTSHVGNASVSRASHQEREVLLT
jgi:hypothetical protein